MFGAQQLETFQRGTGQRGRLTGGVNIGPGELNQTFNQLFTAGHKCTAGAESLAQGADQHRHIVHTQAEVLDNPAAIGP